MADFSSASSTAPEPAMAAVRWHELKQAMIGTARLARGDRRGLACFDPSLDGFWRSFGAGVAGYPFYLAVLVQWVDGARAATAGLGQVVIVETIAYVMSWVAFPLAILPATRWLGREDRFLGFMVVYNWCQLPQLVIFAVIGLLVPAALAQILANLVTIAVIVYEWYIARVTLAIAGVAAGGIVLIDLLLGMLITRAADALY
jgi:hypothetical protein